MYLFSNYVRTSTTHFYETQFPPSRRSVVINTKNPTKLRYPTPSKLFRPTRTVLIKELVTFEARSTALGPVEVLPPTLLSNPSTGRVRVGGRHTGSGHSNCHRSGRGNHSSGGGGSIHQTMQNRKRIPAGVLMRLIFHPSSNSIRKWLAPDLFDKVVRHVHTSLNSRTGDELSILHPTRPGNPVDGSGFGDVAGGNVVPALLVGRRALAVEETSLGGKGAAGTDSEEIFDLGGLLSQKVQHHGVVDLIGGTHPAGNEDVVQFWSGSKGGVRDKCLALEAEGGHVHSYGDVVVKEDGVLGYERACWEPFFGDHVDFEGG